MVSGDTNYCPELIQAARGADVLLQEEFIHDAMKPDGIRTQEIIHNVASITLWIVKWVELHQNLEPNASC